MLLFADAGMHGVIEECHAATTMMRFCPFSYKPWRPGDTFGVEPAYPSRMLRITAPLREMRVRQRRRSGSNERCRRGPGSAPRLGPGSAQHHAAEEAMGCNARGMTLQGVLLPSPRVNLPQLPRKKGFCPAAASLTRAFLPPYGPRPSE